MDTKILLLTIALITLLTVLFAWHPGIGLAAVAAATVVNSASQTTQKK